MVAMHSLCLRQLQGWSLHPLSCRQGCDSCRAALLPAPLLAGVAREETLDIDRIAAETDFIVLTQGIDDHAHKCASWPAGNDTSQAGACMCCWYGMRLHRCAGSPQLADSRGRSS